VVPNVESSSASTPVDPVDEVVAAFDLVLDAIEDAVSGAKESAVAAVQDERFEVELIRARIEELRAYGEDVEALRRRWPLEPQTKAATASVLPLVVNPPEAPPEPESTRRFLGRVRRGERTPEAAFRRPILKALVELGGEASIGTVLDKVEQRVNSELKPVDLLGLPSDPGTVRWRNTAQWSRQELVSLGLLERSRQRGMWAISAAGREWLTAHPE
jgi:hypothetical protein